MRFRHLPDWVVGGILMGMLAGCASTIPPTLASRISWDLSFSDLKRDPEAHKGRLVVLGGIVSLVEFIGTSYRVAVRQYPLDGGGVYRPVVRPPSGGIFLLRFPVGELPKDVYPGAALTAVGEILGKGIYWWAYGEAEEAPMLAVRHVHVWGPAWQPRAHSGGSDEPSP
jgi:outer membrane lipoprotein